MCIFFYWSTINFKWINALYFTHKLTQILFPARKICCTNWNDNSSKFSKKYLYHYIHRIYKLVSRPDTEAHNRCAVCYPSRAEFNIHLSLSLTSPGPQIVIVCVNSSSNRASETSGLCILGTIFFEIYYSFI